MHCKPKHLDSSETKQEPTCLLTLSGGIDSTVLLYKLIRDGEHPLCVYVDYGTKSRQKELEKAQYTCQLLKVDLLVIPLPIYTECTSAYILGNTKEYAEESMFWLEGRNAVIGMLLAVLAAGKGLSTIYLGINFSDDNGEYPDTNRKFVSALNTLIACSFKSDITVRAPWLELKWRKADIIKLGESYKIAWVAQTHSCSSSDGDPCCDYYLCDSCVSRRSDFEEVGLKDPFYRNGQYETGSVKESESED